MSEISQNGCINLVGAIINKAIIDYQSKRVKKFEELQWNTAKMFLFSKGRLESFLEKFNVDGFADASYIRKQAENVMLSRYTSKTAETLIA